MCHDVFYFLFLFLFFEGFSLNEYVTITGRDGLQTLTYTWHSWSLICAGSLAFQTYCNLLKNSSPRTCDTQTCFRTFSNAAVITYCDDRNFMLPTLRIRRECSVRPIHLECLLWIKLILKTYIELFSFHHAA